MAAQTAGAVAVIVVNNVPDDGPDGGLMEMGGDSGRTNPAIPAVLVAHSSGDSIRCSNIM